MSWGQARRRLRRMQAKGETSEGAAGVPEWINPATGKLRKGWRYPGGGRPPVKIK